MFIPFFFFQALKEDKSIVLQQVHKIRITLTSKSMKAVEKGTFLHLSLTEILLQPSFFSLEVNYNSLASKFGNFESMKLIIMFYSQERMHYFIFSDIS